MNILLKILPHNLPDFIRKAILVELFEATAEAFECPAIVPGDLSYDEYLRAYAIFTSEQAEKAFQSGRDIPTIKSHLYRNAYTLGGRLRIWFGANTTEDVMWIGGIFYQAIGVDLRGDLQGDVRVNNCYYSHFYSSSICDLISALDDGFFSGLSRGSRLVFLERITEGRECCKAKLFLEKEGN